jgi:L-iditol 2-dehydrogenase
MKSLAFVYYAPNDVRTETKEIRGGHDNLVVKVRSCGRCGSDKTIFSKGHPKVDPHAPIVLGHELSAEIVKVGSDVKNLRRGIGYKEGETLSPEYLDFKEGERITVQSRIARYNNGLMLIQEPITILSFYIDAGYSQYMRIPKELIQSGSVLRVPENASDEDALLVEPAACALESIFSSPHPVGVDKEGRHMYRSGIQQMGFTAIIGSGTVGLMYARLARIEGAKKVFVFVRSAEKEKMVHNILGSEAVCYNMDGKSQPEIVEETKRLTDGHLFDDVISACSDTDAQKLMLELFTHEGYAVGAVFGGAHAIADSANLDNLHYRMAKAIGTSGCSTRTMETVIQWLKTGKLKLEGFCSKRRWTFRDSPSEFFTARDGGLKPVLDPWG